MFESLRQAFREAVDNFRTELHRDEVPEAADRLLRAMQRELIRRRADLLRLEEELRRVQAEGVREAEELRTCLRREELAARIRDEETMRVARSYAERHLRRKDLLEKKAEVLEQEIREGRVEADQMTRRLEEAASQRDSLAATAGRTGARERLREADDLFDEMDRMAERIGDLEARAAAARELGEMDLEGTDGPTPPREEADADADARLADLKRRMGLG
jgi:hypothetical protein